jgi:hypothetical protein
MEKHRFDDETAFGSLDDLTATFEKRFRGDLGSFFSALVNVSAGDTFEYLNNPEANTGGFRGAVEAFQRAGQLDCLNRLILGLPQPP